MNSELRNVVLSLDTSQYDQLIVGLEIGGEKKVIEEKFDYRKSQGVLPMIERILKDENLSFSELDEIQVATGPGSYTGLRVGVAIANTLGIMLQIPINGQEIGKAADPVYE